MMAKKGRFGRLHFYQYIFLCLEVYSWLMVGSVGIYQYYREREIKVAEINGRLQTINELVIHRLKNGHPMPPVDSLPLKHFGYVRLTLLDSLGYILSDNLLDSIPPRIPSESRRDRPELKEALEEGEGFVLRYRRVEDGELYLYAARYEDGYLVRTGIAYSPTLTELLEPDLTFLWFLVILTAVMCSIGYVVCKRIGRHVSQLREFANRAGLDMDIKLNDLHFTNDEMGNISYAIASLYTRLRNTTEERDRAHRESLKQQEERVKVIQQMSDNINHELKTPVATMQLCIETMLENKDLPCDKRDEFLKICENANTRLKSLMDDVAVLTRIDHGQAMSKKEPVDITRLLHDLCIEYCPMPEKNGMHIINHIDTPVSVTGNSSLIASIFRNLISNAILYSQGSKIEISLIGQDNEKFTFSVADNGKGVDEDKIGLLFERFFRVDKGRSRAVGGTGLGLAIVRNAVFWHGGTIKAENRKSGGLEFIFSLRRVAPNASSFATLIHTSSH